MTKLDSLLVETKLSCPECSSSDAVSRYSDGHLFCFSCNYFYKHEESYLTRLENSGTIFKCKEPRYLKNTQEKKRKKVSNILSISQDIGNLEENLLMIPDNAIYCSHRGISVDTMKKYKVRTTLDSQGNPEKIFFPYGQEAHKTKIISSKDFSSQGSFIDKSLFGIDLFTQGMADKVIITEGELDALSVYQMLDGKYPVLSVRGASSAKKDCLKAREFLKAFKEIVLCLDNDDPGRKATKEISELFDVNMIKFVQFSESLKDANDYLKIGKVKEFVVAFNNADKYRPKGIVSSYNQIKESLNKNGNSKQIATYPFPSLNLMSYGIRLGEVILVKAQEKQGKALSLDTEVPTPYGWSTIGDLKVGDALIGRNGLPTTVTYISPVQHNSTFLVSFQDHTSIKADGTHRWTVRNLDGKEVMLDTQSMYDQGVIAKGSKAKYMVPVAKALQLPEKDLPIDPLLLGAWLADGHSYSAYVTLPKKKLDILKEFNVSYVYEYEDKVPNYMFKELTHKQLRENNLLKNKHIPKEYLRGSIEQRQRLMKGMMFDGWHNEFYTNRVSLRDGFMELVRSLGYTCNYRERGDSGHYTVSFKMKEYKAIRSITPIDTVPSKCLTVDSPDHLFVVGKGWTLTHNTEFIRAIEHHLIKTTDHKIGIIHLEEEEKRTICGLVNYHVQKPVHLPDSGYSTEDILKAYQDLTKIEDRVYIYSHFGSDDPDIILDMIRHLVVSYDCKFIFLDHLTMLVTGLENDGDERKKLDYISTRLAMMTRELGFTLFLISHVNDDGKTRGSRNIAKVADLLISLDRDIEHPDPSTRNTTKVVVNGNRFGGTTGPTTPLFFSTETYCLSEREESQVQLETLNGKNF